MPVDAQAKFSAARGGRYRAFRTRLFAALDSVVCVALARPRPPAPRRGLALVPMDRTDVRHSLAKIGWHTFENYFIEDQRPARNTRTRTSLCSMIEISCRRVTRRIRCGKRWPDRQRSRARESQKKVKNRSNAAAVRSPLTARSQAYGDRGYALILARPSVSRWPNITI